MTGGPARFSGREKAYVLTAANAVFTFAGMRTERMYVRDH